MKSCSVDYKLASRQVFMWRWNNEKASSFYLHLQEIPIEDHAAPRVTA